MTQDPNGPLQTFFATSGLQGIITSNMTLPSGNYTINSSSNVLVDQGATLKISPGATIQLGPGASLLVEGVLLSEGNATHPVVFTCQNSPAVAAPLFVGCYTEGDPTRSLYSSRQSSNGPVMQTSSLGNADLTVDVCASYCAGKGYAYAGLWWQAAAVPAHQCFCSNYNPSTANSNSSCNHACPGNSSQLCGGPSLMSLYRTSACLHWGQITFGINSNGSSLKYTR